MKKNFPQYESELHSDKKDKIEDVMKRYCSRCKNITTFAKHKTISPVGDSKTIRLFMGVFTLGLNEFLSTKYYNCTICGKQHIVDIVNGYR